MSTAKPLFRPLGNRVYVRREVAAKTTAGGLHIPETALRPATDRGIVVAVGPGGVGAHGKHVAVSVSIGDEVLFNRQAIELDVPMDSGSNEKLVIVQEHELLGYRVVKPAAKRGRPVKGATEQTAGFTEVINSMRLVRSNGDGSVSVETVEERDARLKKESV